MARELHDTLAQGLAGLVLQLEAADLHLAGGCPDGRSDRPTGDDPRPGDAGRSRRAIHGLRRQLPDDLEEAIPAEVDHFISDTGVPLPLEISRLPRIRSRKQVQDLRLPAVSESLTNIAADARAHQARVSTTRGTYSSLRSD